MSVASETGLNLNTDSFVALVRLDQATLDALPGAVYLARSME